MFGTRFIALLAVAAVAWAASRSAGLVTELEQLTNRDLSDVNQPGGIDVSDPDAADQVDDVTSPYQ